ncbi:hypothetical protein Pcinc_006478 [Petrolisthes cinctipes]|uniref:PiggyBac transposable element-derived protein domain-containing protein n=1 Tax=Petrolisthes cinctipes TaxID=88211 RepID=A0AAE1KXY4_PETCI|nr:hypothetical protein Pcinc_006478 [Petrolisthes cinctipes]
MRHSQPACQPVSHHLLHVSSCAWLVPVSSSVSLSVQSLPHFILAVHALTLTAHPLLGDSQSQAELTAFNFSLHSVFERGGCVPLLSDTPSTIALQPTMLGAKLFYFKMNTGTVIPSQHYVSDDEDLSDDDDDVADHDFSPPCQDPGLSDISGPSPKRKCTRSAVYFSPQHISNITYQTNLYATQKDVNSSFTTCDDEISGTVDRFFKVFTFLSTLFRAELQTQKQSVAEVMVAYKGKTAGNLRQYIKNKADKWGFKLFARASEDGFIHDMALYQGKTMLQAHGLPLSPEQEAMGSTSQIVSVLASTMSSSTTTAIFADNFFTSLELVRYLKDINCRYTGTVRENRIGKPPLKPVKEMEKSVPCGTIDYVSSDDGILVVRQKDNKVVTLLSTDMGVEPVSSVYRYSSESKRKEEVRCPAVIKSYNANMGGIDKNDRLVHLYRTPMKSKRWYLRLFAYAIDVSLTNAWIMYKRDCKALAEDSIPFKLQMFRSAAGSRPVSLRNPEPLRNVLDMPKPVRGHRATPGNSMSFDRTLFHGPMYAERQTCKLCSHKGHIYRSNIVCMVCKVHLCLNGARNCFIKYHSPVA